MRFHTSWSKWCWWKNSIACKVIKLHANEFLHQHHLPYGLWSVKPLTVCRVSLIKSLSRKSHLFDSFCFKIRDLVTSMKLYYFKIWVLEAPRTSTSFSNYFLTSLSMGTSFPTSVVTFLPNSFFPFAFPFFQHFLP
jgi:hypothetical protein